jgi:predicted NBD/HSP70 family sugar kinase
VWAAGVATTGLVDNQGRATMSTGIPDWVGVDLAAHLATTVSCPVGVDNDGKLAALAEHWCGAAQGADDVIYLLLGLRTGAGLIIGGRLHRGYGGVAGEIGLLPEARWATAQDSLRNWSEAPLGLSADDVAPHVFAAARGGDAGAGKAVRRYIADIAVGTAGLVLALDPELVVLGGGFSRSADMLLEPLRQELARRCVRTPRVVASALGDEAPALGAVRLALDAVERQVFAVEGGAAIPEPPSIPARPPRRLQKSV